MTRKRIVLEEQEAHPDGSAHELARVVLGRFGLLARKTDGNAQLAKLLLELNERKKEANRDRNPARAVMPVEEMGLVAGIARQTVYDHLKRWLALDVLKKTSFVADGRVVIGYELNGPTIDAAFKKAETRIHNHLHESFRTLDLLKQRVKSDKLSASSATKES